MSDEYYTYVVTEQVEDPFVSGGVPMYAFVNEQDAWNFIAWQAAWEGWAMWTRVNQVRWRRSLPDCIADSAVAWEVYKTPIMREPFSGYINLFESVE